MPGSLEPNLKHVRVGGDANLGGCAYLLQIWIWERFPVGRPYRGPIEAWPRADAETRPIVAFCWKNVGVVRGDLLRRYMRYMDDLDSITQNQYRPEEKQRQRMEPTLGAVHRNNHYKEYRRWFHSVTRVSIKPPRSNVPIEERANTDDEDDIVDEYDGITRTVVQSERAPLENYMAQQLARLANEARVAIAHASGGEDGGGHLRAFAEFVQLAARAGASSARRTSSSMRTPYHYGQGTTTTPSRSTSRTGSRAASKGKAASSRQDSSDSEQDTDSDDMDPTYEVVGIS
ncbi:hypothetical protein C2845_PM01G43440 [Panicum miliaceum]|uniref:Aminotransferase-like plant mobile domain-containing protein n=1 Tax=Panicum miliaceum TaxID=4540 RepID=A0A3L6TKV0_PANMI|nr:hypothetical protein C2845_PM01G43440 [Panicum miliaceum]